MTGVSRLYHGISNLVTRINDILKRNVSFCCNFQNSLVRKTSWFVLKYLSWLSPAWMEKVPLPMKNGCCKNGRKCLWVSLKKKKRKKKTVANIPSSLEKHAQFCHMQNFWESSKKSRSVTRTSGGYLAALLIWKNIFTIRFTSGCERWLISIHSECFW